MKNDIIDLRSDTVTKPSAAMRAAITDAEVGDDVFGEDPTVNRLQEKVAGLLGKESALFVPSGTMANEICVKVHTNPGEEVICEAGCHILNYESGAAAFLSGVQILAISGQHGVLPLDKVKSAIRPDFYYLPKTSLITVENTHNSAGGTIYPLAGLQSVYQLAKENNLKLHMDGARIWNASVASGISVSEYAKHCDSISVCFSKGLGAPIGSAIAGSREFIEKAHRFRKLLGGGMRQVGLLAAAALYALDNNIERLEQDHQNARFLAEAIAQIPGIEIDLASVQTNIIIFDITKTQKNVNQVMQRLKKENVLVVPFGATKLRAVTHLNVKKARIEKAIAAFKNVFN